jgi:hypothetical protein
MTATTGGADPPARPRECDVAMRAIIGPLLCAASPTGDGPADLPSPRAVVYPEPLFGKGKRSARSGSSASRLRRDGWQILPFP